MQGSEPKKPSESSQLAAQTSRDAPLVRGNNFIWLEDNGIVHLRVGTEEHRNGKPYTKMDALDAKEGIEELTADRSKIYIIADMRNARKITAEARRVHSSARTQRLALWVGNPVSRMLGNVYLGLNGGAFPTRLFTDESKATEWLLGEGVPSGVE